MHMLGVGADHPEPLQAAMNACTAQRLPFVVFSDGDDLFGLFADQGETVDDVQREAARCMPWGAA